ncbi:MAG: SDR family NAD(P)-dependent oxidoreductase [Pyrinomonadaceae bacterium]
MSLPSIHQFAEKVALISGVSSPAGRAVAIQLALNGAYVVGVSPKGDQAAARLANELAELGTLARSVSADVWTDEGARSAAAEVGSAFGRLDILVNCLKFVPESSFFEISEPALSEALMRNIGPAVFLTRSVLDLMKPRPRPRIVNIAAASGSVGNLVFEAAQAGLRSLTRDLSRTLPESFRVNCVEFAAADRNAGIEGENLHPTTRITEPDDVARAVLFLLSSESKAVNGNVMTLG